MSIDLRVIVGPYIECSFVPVEMPTSHKACLNDECRSFKLRRDIGAQFCSYCGHQFGEVVTTIKTSPVEVYDIEKIINNTLYNVSGTLEKSPHIFLPNIHSWTKLDRITIDLDEFNGFEVREITDKYRKEIMDEFIHFFEKEIVHLVNAYSRENVVVKFGCVAYSV